MKQEITGEMGPIKQEMKFMKEEIISRLKNELPIAEGKILNWR